MENGQKEAHLMAGAGGWGRVTERIRAGPHGLRPALHLRFWL